MSEDIRILRAMIRDAARVSIKENPYGRRQVTLAEPQDPEGRKVTITGLPDDAVVIKCYVLRNSRDIVP
ncbi:MAG: hypothetical protein BECKG1743D_GA0114223_110473 [Candidatus Kentron sp. G]|nr:MAG: hypothetical protein BECKG1743F_GA0114225_110833 [Candidatus Kentron sp. G]VFN07372.1 MAG: hypothetical protein BECKG1743D_GA0114223_110473 [Candidatus Kentron sp. G]VFN07393.1 MAG: hypothetical protein BECKG1743E_GA0114224_112003 [Candidatus Kentron sp. G]